MPIASVNPATGETLKTFEALNESQVNDKLQHAASTFTTYRHTTFAARESMFGLRPVGL